MNKVIVFSLEKRFKKSEERIFRAANKLLKILKKNNCYLEIYLVGNKTMSFLNKKFRGKSYPADVLSFSEPQGFPRPELTAGTQTKKMKPLGEIYLNMSKTNLSTSGQNLKIELLIHGVLHLFGYNHKIKNDKVKMEKMEQKLLRQILNPKS